MVTGVRAIGSTVTVRGMLFALPLAAFLVDPGVSQAFPDDDVVVPTNARPVLLLESPARPAAQLRAHERRALALVALSRIRRRR